MEHWDKINAVQRMQDHIERNMNERITLRKLANEAGYSPWHSSRIFCDLTGKTPFDYIRALRLSRAAMKLRDGDAKIIDVAFDFDFDSHEGFTRAFSKQFGITPVKYRINAPPVHLFMPSRIRDYYLMIQKGDENMTEKAKTCAVFVQVVERPARKMILKRGIKATQYFEYCEEVGCDIWGLLVSIKEAIHEPAGLWLPVNLRKPGTSEYVQGVEVPLNYSGVVPEGLEIVELPACKLMVFQGPPFEDQNYGEAISDLWEVMKTYKPEIYGFKWADEDAPRMQLEPQGYRGYIEARPVKSISN